MSSYDAAPAPWDMPAGVSRHTPTLDQQRDGVRHLGSHLAWAELAWPQLVEALVALGRTDIPLSRLTEGHVDALRILREAGLGPEPGALYGVWASRSRASGLTGSRTPTGWVLDGPLEFASGAGIVDRALVPVWPAGDDSVLLDLPVQSWAFDDSRWHTRAMELSRTHRIRLRAHPTSAREVGEPGWYLGRRGFFPGGVGVAAVWAGGAARVADLLCGAVPANRRTPAQAVRLGRIRTDVATAVALCRDAAARLDQLPDPALAEASALARGGVAAAVRRVLGEARTVAGPVGLAMEEDLTRAIDDLGLYVAQHNADADAARLGEELS